MSNGDESTQWVIIILLTAILILLCVLLTTFGMFANDARAFFDAWTEAGP